MNQPIISVSGLRGILGQSLTPEIVSGYVAAFVEQLPEGRVLVARDGRPSGAAFADVVRSTTQLLGRDVIDAGIAATPTVGVLVREHACQGAIQISASHNPSQYNGLKLMGADGRVIPADKGEQVKAAYLAKQTTLAPYNEIGIVTHCDDTTADHLAKVLETVDAAVIRKKKYKVLLDANAGSGSILGIKLLEELGCQVEVLGGSPDGHFLHPPEPTAENLSSTADLVKKGKFDIAFCQDPDADRLAIIDEKGRYIGEEYTLALCLQNVLRKRTGPVVINGATSRMNEDIANSFHCPIYRSTVGEANVTQEMILQEAVFGGEGSGGPIDPQVGYIRDSLVGMANVLELLSTLKKSVGNLTDTIPAYVIQKHKVEANAEQLAIGFERLKEEFKEAQLDARDGLRFAWENRWLIARASNTEPIVRVIAESKSEKETAEMCETAKRLLSGF